MAERRMFAKTIIDSDAFLEMPQSSQLLYFHLSMRADDDGFINKPKAIIRLVGCKEDDMKILIAKKFIIPFDTGVVVIKHWKIHNYIRSDRYTETKYKDEKAILSIDENNAYRLSSDSCLPSGIPTVSKMDTQVRLGKDRLELGKDRIEKEERKTSFSPTLYIQERQFSPFLEEKIIEWVNYKKERRETYKETGLKSLCTQIQNKVNEYGEAAVCNLITECMANGWKGIIWDKLKNQQPQSGNVFLDIAMEGDGVF